MPAAKYIRRAERVTKDGNFGQMPVKRGDWEVYWSDGTMEAMTHAEFVALPEAEIDAPINCGFCGNNSAECDCPHPV